LVAFGAFLYAHKEKEELKYLTDTRLVLFIVFINVCSVVHFLLLSRNRFRLLRLTMTTVIVWIRVMSLARRLVLMDGV